MEFLKLFGSFFFFQVWFVLGTMVLAESNGHGFCLRGLEGFLFLDVICLVAYLYGKRRGIKKTNNSFNILPMKWFGILTIVGFLCEIHGDDYFPMCVFLCVTTLIWYLYDLYERYHLWKEPHPRL